mmetsp:Transcript_94265/g.224432  ORF Transcript_94265/g.224432 Transcript_94265/m.224432 type:complete len:206 (-) Transcript_94265:160-777(-)
MVILGDHHAHVARLGILETLHIHSGLHGQAHIPARTQQPCDGTNCSEHQENVIAVASALLPIFGQSVTQHALLAFLHCFVLHSGLGGYALGTCFHFAVAAIGVLFRLLPLRDGLVGYGSFGAALLGLHALEVAILLWVIDFGAERAVLGAGLGGISRRLQVLLAFVSHVQHLRVAVLLLMPVAAVLVHGDLLQFFISSIRSHGCC